MKAIKITLIVLACLLVSNFSMAGLPQKSKIENQKTSLINRIAKTISNLRFVDCMKCGEHNQVILRCMVDTNNKVVVEDIVGLNKDLKLTIIKRIEQTNFKPSTTLCGQKLALRLKFEKHEQ